MYYVCLRYLKQKSDACDILQESFIQVYKKIRTFKGVGNFEGWLRRIVINKCLEHLRTRKSYVELEYLDSNLEVEATDADIELEENENLKEVLFQAISQLSDGYRTIINLIIVEGYSHKEAAQMVGISESTSRSQLVRARAQLKKILKNGKSSDKINNYYDRV